MKKSHYFCITWCHSVTCLLEIKPQKINFKNLPLYCLCVFSPLRCVTPFYCRTYLQTRSHCSSPRPISKVKVNWGRLFSWPKYPPSTISRFYSEVEKLIFYIIKLFAHLYVCIMYIYMLAIAGQTAGPNLLNFLREPMSTPEVS